ncbi:unnamed protein product, partial [Coregonus sp. 'balchen']
MSEKSIWPGLEAVHHQSIFEDNGDLVWLKGDCIFIIRDDSNSSGLAPLTSPGQVEVCAVLQVPDLEPEQTEFYVVLEGSRLAHVTVGKRTEDGKSLCFTAPGHDLQETVSVTAYCHTEGRSKPCGGRASLKYVCDSPQEVAEYLLANSDCLSPQSHLEVLRRVSGAPGEGNRDGDRSSGPGEEHYLEKTDQEEGCGFGRPRPDPEVVCRLREMDERITQAMANLDYPPEWSGKASQPREAEGSEGTDPRSPPVGVCCVWADRTCVLRVCPGSGSLTLTFLGGPESSISALRGDVDVQMEDSDVHTSDTSDR